VRYHVELQVTGSTFDEVNDNLLKAWRGFVKDQDAKLPPNAEVRIVMLQSLHFTGQMHAQWREE